MRKTSRGLRHFQDWRKRRPSANSDCPLVSTCTLSYQEIRKNALLLLDRDYSYGKGKLDHLAVVRFAI
jgi:hypothetical protein